MELSFLGRGAGFNPGEGSTSAYFVDNGEMFLIDSGESTFYTLQGRKLLDSVSKLHIFITHTHSDHVGSLGSLILYAFAAKKIDVHIITDENMEYIPSIRSLLAIYGLTDTMYRFSDSSDYDGRYSVFEKFRYFKTKHCDELKSCGILFETDAGLVFYSGDINDPAPVAEAIESGRIIDKMYIDSNNDRHPNPHHVSIHQLNEIVPRELRPKILCMHIKNDKCVTEAKAYGFSVVDMA